MTRKTLFRDGCIVALFFVAQITNAIAQQRLPTIDVGGARPGHDGKPARQGTAARAGNLPAQAQGAIGGGDGTGAGPNIGAGRNGQICADGVCNDPKSYAAPVESLGTKVNTLVMNTALNTKTVTQQMLQDQQVTSLDQALRNVSGISVTQGGAAGLGTGYSGVNIRGFQTNAFYRDGIRIDNFGPAFSGMNGVEFANIDSVEVLKGPAAMLYGAVEPGGILNLNMKQPLDKAAFSLQQQVGSYSSYRTVFDATGPLTDNKAVLYRFIGSYENDGSWQQYGYRNSLMLNPVIKWNIDADTSIKLETQYQNLHLNQNFGYIPYFNTFAPLWLGRSWNWGPPSALGETSTFSQLTFRRNINTDWAVKVAAFMQTATSRGDGSGPFSIADCITPGADPFGQCGVVPGFTPGAVTENILQYTFNNRQAEYASVVDLTGRFKTGVLDHALLLGGDYYRYNYRGPNLASYQPGLVGMFGAPQFPTLPSQLYPANANAQQANNIGAYAQDQIDLPYGFHIMGGARYQYVQSDDAGDRFK